MIRINLLPLKEAQRALGRRNQLSVALLSVTLALLVMVIPYVLQGRKMTQLDGEIDQLRSEIRKFNEQTQEFMDLNRKKADLEARLKIIEDLKQKRVGPVHILEDLGAAAPDKLWLLEFGDTNGVATITGLSLDNQTIATFMRKLQASKYFFNVDLVETSQSEPIRNPNGGDGGLMFKKFIIKAQLDYLGTGGQSAKEPPASGTPGAPKTGA